MVLLYGEEGVTWNKAIGNLLWWGWTGGWFREHCRSTYTLQFPCHSQAKQLIEEVEDSFCIFSQAFMPSSFFGLNYREKYYKEQSREIIKNSQNHPDRKGVVQPAISHKVGYEIPPGFRALSSWVLKNSKDGDCTTSLDNVWQSMAILVPINVLTPNNPGYSESAMMNIYREFRALSLNLKLLDPAVLDWKRLFTRTWYKSAASRRATLPICKSTVQMHIQNNVIMLSNNSLFLEFNLKSRIIF